MTEKRIAKITEADGVLFKGMAEGMEWTVVPSVFSQPIEAGDFILCHVLTADDEIFHLEAIPHVPKQTQEEWTKQEQQYI